MKYLSPRFFKEIVLLVLVCSTFVTAAEEPTWPKPAEIFNRLLVVMQEEDKSLAGKDWQAARDRFVAMMRQDGAIDQATYDAIDDESSRLGLACFASLVGKEPNQEYPGIDEKDRQRIRTKVDLAPMADWPEAWRKRYVEYLVTILWDKERFIQGEGDGRYWPGMLWPGPTLMSTDAEFWRRIGPIDPAGLSVQNRKKIADFITKIEDTKVAAFLASPAAVRGGQPPLLMVLLPPQLGRLRLEVAMITNDPVFKNIAELHGKKAPVEPKVADPPPVDPKADAVPPGRQTPAEEMPQIVDPELRQAGAEELRPIHLEWKRWQYPENPAYARHSLAVIRRFQEILKTHPDSPYAAWICRRIANDYQYLTLVDIKHLKALELDVKTCYRIAEEYWHRAFVALNGQFEEFTYSKLVRPADLITAHGVVTKLLETRDPALLEQVRPYELHFQQRVGGEGEAGEFDAFIAKQDQRDKLEDEKRKGGYGWLSWVDWRPRSLHWTDAELRQRLDRLLSPSNLKSGFSGLERSAAYPEGRIPSRLEQNLLNLECRMLAIMRRDPASIPVFVAAFPDHPRIPATARIILAEHHHGYMGEKRAPRRP